MPLTLPDRNRMPNADPEDVGSLLARGKRLLGGVWIIVKGIGWTVLGTSIKAGRGALAGVGGALLGPIMAGLGYKKMDILKIITSPILSWGQQIKNKWREIPKTEGNRVWAAVKGIGRSIFPGIFLGLFSGGAAFIGNVGSAIRTLFGGGIKFAFDVADLTKETGAAINRSTVLSGVCQTNVLGTMLLGAAKFLEKLNITKYRDIFNKYIKKTPDPIEYVRQKMLGVTKEKNVAKERFLRTAKQLQNRAAGAMNHMIGMRHQADTMAKMSQNQIKGRMNRIRTQTQQQVHRARAGIERMGGEIRRNINNRLSTATGKLRSDIQPNANNMKQKIAATQQQMSSRATNMVKAEATHRAVAARTMIGNQVRTRTADLQNRTTALQNAGRNKIIGLRDTAHKKISSAVATAKNRVKKTQTTGQTAIAQSASNLHEQRGRLNGAMIHQHRLMRSQQVPSKPMMYPMRPEQPKPLPPNTRPPRPPHHPT